MNNLTFRSGDNPRPGSIKESAVSSERGNARLDIASFANEREGQDKDQFMPIQQGRHTARIEGDFVLFLIGVRINRPWLVHKWVPTVLAMPGMLKELAHRPELGLLHAEPFISGLTVQIVQYWRSFEHLHAYAHARDLEHLPAWAAFNRRTRGNSAVGIFHETYLIPADHYECIHVNMPRAGLLRAGESVPVTGRNDSARQRLPQETDKK